MEDARGRLQVLKLITDVGADGPALAEVLEHVRTQLPVHPGLLPVTEVGLSDEGVYLASPVLDAPTVEGRLRGGRQTLDATLDWLRGVIAGLQAAHDVGVWHGAIHPRDILETDEGGVLTGVGVAPALEHVSLQAPVRVPYTAPERASGRAWDARADQYSLAMLALDALSGRRLIAGTIPAFDRWTLAETPTEDARLHEVFVRALHPDPDERFASLDAFLHALAGPDHAAASGALSRFAREGVIVTPPAAVPQPEPVPIVLEADARGSTLSLFPEEPLTTDAPLVDVEGRADETATGAGDAGAQDAGWLVADVPRDEAAAEPDELTLRAPAPAASPTGTHERGVAPPAAPADWQFDTAAEAEAAPAWGARTEESSSLRPWLVVAVLVVVAALGYGTWRSLQTPEPPAATAGPADVDGPATPKEPSALPAPKQARPAEPAAEAKTGRRSDSAASAGRPAGTAGPTVVPGPTVAPRPTGASGRADTGGQAAADRPAAEAVPGTGRALIRSSPAGAVRVNGRPRGQTPLVLRDLPFGTYLVTVSRPGFRTEEREVVLLASQPVASVSVDLVREGAAAPAAGPSAAEPPPGAQALEGRAPIVATRAGRPDAGVGAIFVVSTPSPARLFVDGQAYGSTPAAVPGLTAGAHTVRVELPGYRTWEGQVAVVPGTRVRVQATLQQEQE